MFSKFWLFSSIASVILTSLACAQDSDKPKDLPEEFRQILPRGRIAAIDNPEFVTANQADIADDAWVLGVEINGQARAYSLSLLNSHEVVNDQVGDSAFAAVW